MNTDNPRTLAMPARDVRLTAVFEPKEEDGTSIEQNEQDED